MIVRKLLTSRRDRTAVLGMVAAIVALTMPSVGLAQNQSDVTGPNLSDITGPNLSDVTGINQSDNAIMFELFFNEFGEELGVDGNADLAEQLRQASLACSERAATIRRFARNPGTDSAEITPACAELSRLIQLARDSLEQSGSRSSAVDRRIW